MGNRPDPKALAALIRGLGDAEAMVRAACAWALGRYPQAAARAALDAQRTIETDHEVRGEIDASLAGLNPR